MEKSSNKQLFSFMPENFLATTKYNGALISVSVLPQSRPDGMYYEINLKGYPRFYMTWSALDRYDIVPDSGVKIPYDLILLVSDLIEERVKD